MRAVCAGLVFKTLRYPGHLDYIRFLLDDMGLSQRIYQFRSLLMTSLPKTALDRVLIALRVVPEPGARAAMANTDALQAGTDAAGQVQSASVTATAAHVCAVLDVLTVPDAPAVNGLGSAGHVCCRMTCAARRSLVCCQSRIGDGCGGQDDQAESVAGLAGLTVGSRWTFLCCKPFTLWRGPGHFRRLRVS